jgi:hypothetical protein
MTRPSTNKQQQWKQDFQQRAAYAFATNKRSNVKAFIAGPYVVVKLFGKSVALPGISPTVSSSQRGRSRQEAPWHTEMEESLGGSGSSFFSKGASSSAPRTPEENRRRNIKRKQTDLQLLIHQNFSPSTAVFATLTFGQSCRDIRKVIRECQKLFKRIRRHIPGVKYVAIPERHDNGGWHVHLVLDRELPLTRSLAQSYIDSGSITSKSGSWENLWAIGFVHQKRLDQGGNLGASIAAYVMKNATDKDLARHHTVWKSDNLEQPTEICGQDAVDLLHSFVSGDLAPSYGYHCEKCRFVQTMDVYEFCLDPQAALLNKAWWHFASVA